MNSKQLSVPQVSGVSKAPNSAHKLRMIVALFVLIFLCLLILDNFRIQALSNIRAYVEGEGLWSKAQKESVIALRRYARSHSGKDFHDYLMAIAVPLGDRQARLELEKASPNYDLVNQGFLQGGNHKEDLRGMATLFRRFRRISYMAAAIDTWTQGDRDVVELQDAADALHQEIVSGRGNPEVIETLVRRIEEIDNHLTRLEDQFSDQMTSGSYMMSYFLSLFVFGFSGALLAAGVTVSFHLAGQIHKSEAALVVANESLTKSERRFRSLIQDLSDVILVLAHDGTLYYASHSAGRTFGYEPRELTGQNIFTLIHRDDSAQFRNCLERAALNEGATIQTEFRLRRKGGTWISLEATGNPLNDDPFSGKALITCRDVTDRRRLEHELGQSQKMEAVGRLAGGIAHDFNNLLAIIGGYAEIMTGQLHPQDPIRKSAEIVLKTVERGSALTKRLLSFTRKQVMTPRLLKLKSILEEMSKILPRLIGEEIEIVLRSEPSAGMIYADAVQIEQILINLAVNSRDAMPSGGKLTIETRDVDLDDSEYPFQQFVLPRSYVLLSVSDTGCGMSAETKSHLFEPFFTTKEHGKGTGLGLSIVYGIVKHFGGYVLVESEPDVGTCVRIYFPRIEVEAEVPLPAKNSTIQRVQSGFVLVVEDEDFLRNMVGEYLTQAGYTVMKASSATEAMALAQQCSHSIDILITDVILPKTRGPELARALQEKFSQLKVIYISGYTGTSLVRDGILEAGTVLIQKPFKLRELIDAMSRVQTMI
jgi:PAS domain S-box-containing protein